MYTCLNVYTKEKTTIVNRKEESDLMMELISFNLVVFLATIKTVV